MCGPPFLSQGDPMDSALEVFGVSVRKAARPLGVRFQRRARGGRRSHAKATPKIGPGLCSVPHEETRADCVFCKCTRHFVLPRL